MRPSGDGFVLLLTIPTYYHTKITCWPVVRWRGSPSWRRPQFHMLVNRYKTMSGWIDIEVYRCHACLAVCSNSPHPGPWASEMPFPRDFSDCRDSYNEGGGFCRHIARTSGFRFIYILLFRDVTGTHTSGTLSQYIGCIDCVRRTISIGVQTIYS